MKMIDRDTLTPNADPAGMAQGLSDHMSPHNLGAYQNDSHQQMINSNGAPVMG